ncbi:type I restriction-modification system subunit M [Aliarcobacter butzleri]|uniref:type I restriction-modification system subunit M n=1 Tax=Aliarcobacter butzleri TaxID=28197 RepID=UPI0021B541ED|nr:class I SAM-dependent DNA methyltransferase [Aliarcobacter butzleri]MCT7570855.1 type I restriction-modification system subunit M [Aliarcobacter butzleri]
MEVRDLQPIINFIWTVADDVLRDVYTKGKYRDIILPMTVIRRLDTILEPTKEKVLQTYNQYKDKLDNLDSLLTGNKLGSGHVFYNRSNYTLQKLLDDPNNIRANFENYLDGFSSNVQDIINKFKFRNQLDTLEEADILFTTIEKFCTPKINLSTNPVLDKDGNVIHQGLTNLGMGYVFEDLIRRFNEENNEEAGEHFTPREIVNLMTHLIFLPIKDKIKDGTYLIYDNACGSGGMLTEAKKFMTDPDGEIQSNATIHMYGQEISPETFAICKADMMIKEENPDNIKYGSTLSNDQLGHLTFDFMLTNPPYGKSWEKDQKAIGVKKAKGQTVCDDDRFQVGITNSDDGQMMFLLNMISKMKHDTQLGSRIASVHNGSSLFNSNSGQVAIRRHIIESDYLEAIIGLPTNMFYNTGIPTFIWIITNRKPENKKGKVQLINATSEKFYQKMKKSLGDKQHEMTDEHVKFITEMFINYADNYDCMILDNEEFGYTKIVIEKPKSVEDLLQDEKFLELEKKDEIITKLKEIEEQKIEFENKDEFVKYLGVKLTKGQLNFIINNDKNTNTEKIALKQDIQSYYDREVKPYVPSSWIDWDSGSIGYEILFNKYFYTYTPPRTLSDIAKDLKALEEETEDLLEEITR